MLLQLDEVLGKTTTPDADLQSSAQFLASVKGDCASQLKAATALDWPWSKSQVLQTVKDARTSLTDAKKLAGADKKARTAAAKSAAVEGK